MSRTAVPSSSVMVSRWSRICRCTVTSRADVGSSAMSRRGLHERPMAMSARWRMPPENSCGYWLARASASGRPASESTFATSCGELGSPLARRVSRTWKPIFQTGLRLDMGSWGTIPMEVPRSSTMRFSEAEVMSSPSKMMLPLETRPLEGRSPIAASAVVDFPDPDSPTIATVSPGMTVRCAFRTAWTSPFAVPNVMARSRSSSSGWTAAADCVGFPILELIVCVPLDRGRPAARRRA